MKNLFSAEDKHRVMKGYAQSGLSIPAYSRESGVSESTLYKWQKQVRDKELPSRGVEREFIELGGESEKYYEIQRGAVVLKVPSSESIERISEIIKSLH